MSDLENQKADGWVDVVALVVPWLVMTIVGLASASHGAAGGVTRVLASWAPAFGQLALVILGAVALGTAAALVWGRVRAHGRRWAA